MPIQHLSLSLSVMKLSMGLGEEDHTACEDPTDEADMLDF